MKKSDAIKTLLELRRGFMDASQYEEAEVIFRTIVTLDVVEDLKATLGSMDSLPERRRKFGYFKVQAPFEPAPKPFQLFQ